MDKENGDISEEIGQKSVEKICGILRMNTRATSPLLSLQQVEPSSPQPSVDRVSVTFAIGEDDDNEDDRRNVQEDNTTDAEEVNDMQRISIAEEEEGNEDDYSESAFAIMQRRSSSRRQSRRKRRPSSPFGAESEPTHRRRSSVYTISSGETAISIEESGSQEQIFEKLKLHKEVLSGVKQQPWPLRRKIRLVRQAKSYIRKHEGVLQERLAHTRSTKDAIARISLFTTKKWQYCRREMVNLQTWLIPWELRIKEIESHFGSAVASYFTFLRWLFWINLVMSAIITAFVAIPEVLTADPAAAGERKIMLREEKIKSKHLLTLWEFEGILKYSPFFYGWYTNQDSETGYRLPLAYFVTNLVLYIYSFVAILRKVAENSRLSKLIEKEEEYVFSWKLFTGWDFMIGNPETAHNRVSSIVMGFKEALLEEAEKEKDERNWKIIIMRIFVNISVMSLLALSACAVIEVVARSAEELEQNDWWRQNEITVVTSLINYFFPIFFEILGLLESYHPRKQLRLQLARIMVLNLLNLYSLIFALFGKISSMKNDLQDLQPTTTNCSYKPIVCNKESSKSKQVAALVSLSLILASNGTDLQRNNKTNPAPPPYLMLPSDFYLNPIMDEKTLEEIYNIGDYYENYDEYGLEGNETAQLSTEQALEDNSTFTEHELNDTLQTTIFSTDDRFIETSVSESSEQTSDTSSSSMNFYETTAHDEPTETTINGTSTANTVNEDLIGSSIMDISTSSTATETVDEYSITTERTNTEPPVITTMFAGKPSAETADKTAIDSSTSSNEHVIPLEEKDYVVKCFEQVCTTTTQDTIASSKVLDLKTRKKLRRLCWETMFGQELAKLTVMDLVFTIVSTLGIDFFRAVFIRYMNDFWCWDLEKQFPQYGDFKIAENILHLVNNQGMIWMGMFFSPGLTTLNLLKLGILMYLRSWAVLTCNVPHEVIFRASRSNNFYFALLLTMLLLCVLPVGYAIVWVEPSWHCGPFSGYKKIYHLATKQLTDSLPETIQRCLDYMASPGIVIPLILLMTLIIYYMVSLTKSLREANNDLKIQLRHERTEERRKLFKIVKREGLVDSSVVKWKKMLPALSKKSTKSRSPKAEPEVEAAELTDVEEDPFPPASENNYKASGSTSGRTRLTKVLRDSWESQSSDCAVIPEIRINEVEGKSEDQARSISTENRDSR